MTASKRELKFAPLDSMGFATQPTYQQVRDALLIAINKEINNDLVDIWNCIELEVYQEPPVPVRARPTGTTDEEIEESRELNRLIHEIKTKKYDRRLIT